MMQPTPLEWATAAGPFWLPALLLLACVWMGWSRRRDHARLQAYAKESQALLHTMHLYGLASITDATEIITEVSASKRAEEALRWSQSLLQMMATASPLGFLVVDDCSAKVLYFNQRLFDVWGIGDLAQPLQQGTITGHDLFAQCRSRVVDGSAFAAACLALQDPNNALAMDSELVLTGDRALHCYSNQIRDADGAYHGRLYTFEDITARRRAEVRAQQGMQLLQTAVETLDEGFVLFDPQDRLVFCNQKYRQVYGANELLVPGARFEDVIRASALRGIYAESVGRVEEWVAERMALHLADSSTAIQRHSNGRTLRVEECRLADGHVVGLRIDITELTRAIEAAQASSQAKSQFVANMSHEIRTPMNAILGMLQLLKFTELTPRQLDYASKCYAAGQSLLALLNDILDFSKVEAECMTLESYPFDLDVLCLELQTLFGSEAHAKALVLNCDRGAAVPRCLVGDAMRMRQILVNLISNAIKFTAHGEVTLSLSLQQLQTDSATVGFQVTDTGMGIAPEHLAHIFEGFTQAESSTTRRFGGSGLGLAIAKRMVALMGGDLQVQSTLGVGSQFSFTLTLPVAPYVTGASSAADAIPIRGANAALSLPGAVSPEGPLQGMRILLVEDNLINQQVALELLQAQGATVQVANNGREGVDAILQAGDQPLDVVLMDLQMPVLDGIAATREIRATPGLQRLPIVAMTANAMPADREACMQAGMNDHIGKPFELEHLIQLLRRQAGWALGTAGQGNAMAISDALQKTADATGVKLVPALRRLGGNLPLYTRTLDAFMADMRVLDQQLAAPGPMDRIADLAQQLHTVKGLAATVGLDRLAEVARQAEALLKHADPGAFLLALGHMRQAIAEHLPALDAMHRVLLAEAQGETEAAPTGVLLEQRLAVLDRLQLLQEQLAAEDFDALNTLALMQGACGGNLSEALEPLQEAMAELDFEAALQQCAWLIAQMSAHTELELSS